MIRKAVYVGALVALIMVPLGAVGGAARAVPVSTGKPPAYFVDPATLPFAALPGSTTQRFWGIQDGSGWRIEVPSNWNGDLVLFAHGFAGTGLQLFVDNPPIRPYLVQQGYAWAASSYNANGYNVPAGVKGTHELIGLFRHLVGQPHQIFMTGLSMGGQITGVEIEQYPQDFSGAMAWCGVMADSQLFDYYYNFVQGTAALAGQPGQFPPGPSYPSAVENAILPPLGVSPALRNSVGFPDPGTLSTAGYQSDALAEELTGGPRPGFDGAFQLYWNAFGFAPLTQLPFLFGLFGSSAGGTIGIAPGNVVGNIGTSYSLATGDPSVHLTAPQLAAGAATVNTNIQRVAVSPQGTHPNGLSSIPVVSGKIPVPVLTIHGLGDMFVPLSMEQTFAQRVAAAGRSNLLVQRVVREVEHCDYTPAELDSSFRDLVNWVSTGARPAGDDVMAPLTQGYNPDYGCKFTDPSPTAHLVFAAAAAFDHLAPCTPGLEGSGLDTP